MCMLIHTSAVHIWSLYRINSKFQGLEPSGSILSNIRLETRLTSVLAQTELNNDPSIQVVHFIIVLTHRIIINRSPKIVLSKGLT